MKEGHFVDTVGDGVWEDKGVGEGVGFEGGAYWMVNGEMCMAQ